jgi:hypothetical protein
VQVVLILVVVMALAAFAVSWVMRAYHAMAVSLGIAMAALGLNAICGALMPRWERPWWKAPGSRPPTVRVGRLSSFGFGSFFGALGMAFLGYDWLPVEARLALVGAIVAGFILAVLGGTDDGRRAEEGRTIEEVPPAGGGSPTSGATQGPRPADEAVNGDP